MGVSVQSDLPHTLDETSESRHTTQFGSHDQRVHKEPNQPFCLPSVTVCNYGADSDIILAGILAQEPLESRQQNHEQGSPLLLAKLFQLVTQSLRKAESYLPCWMTCDIEPQIVSRQVHCRDIRQVFAPVRQLLFQYSILKLPFLPYG